MKPILEKEGVSQPIIRISVRMGADGGIEEMQVDGDDVEAVEKAVSSLQDDLIVKKNIPKR